MTHPAGFFSGDELERRLEKARTDRALYLREALGHGRGPHGRKAAAGLLVGGAALIGLAAFASLRPAGPIPLGAISPTELTLQAKGLPVADAIDAH